MIIYVAGLFDIRRTTGPVLIIPFATSNIIYQVEPVALSNSCFGRD